MSDYTQTEVGMIPSDWSVESIGEAFTICNNLRLAISHRVRAAIEGQFPYYGPTGIQGYINEYRLEGEFALIGEDGDHFLKWQNQSMTQLVCGRFNVNNHAHVIRGAKNLTSWFYHYYSRRDIAPYLTRQGAGRYKLSKGALIRMPCVLPSTKAEQGAICAVLDDADALVRSLEQTLIKKRRIKQGVMQELLTGRRRLAGFTDDWIVMAFGTVVHLRRERVDPKQTAANDFCIELENLGPGTGRLVGYTTTSEGSSLKSVFLEDDVLFGKLRAYLSKHWLATREGVCSTEIWVLVAERALLLPTYLAQLVKSDSFVEAASASYGTHMPRSDWNVVKSHEVLLPPLTEQIAIATLLSVMDADIAALETKLLKARVLKQGMMQQLLTGRIRLV